MKYSAPHTLVLFILIFLSALRAPSSVNAQQCYPSASTAGYGRGFSSPDTNTAEELGFYTWFAGDINGDGFVDVAATKYRGVGTSSFSGERRIAFYSGEDLSLLVQYSFGDATLTERLGERGGTVGDINLDGKDEFFFVSQKNSYPVRNGRIHVVSLSSGELYSIFGNQSDFGDGAATIPDLNGDGIPEIAAGPITVYPPGSIITARAFQIYSGADGTLLATHQEPANVHISSFGSRIYPVGDFNGDGVNDIIVGGPFDIAIYSGADLLSENIQPITTIEGTGSENPIFVRPIANLGDFDGDNDDEIAFATNWNGSPFINLLRWNQSTQQTEWLRFPQAMHGVSSIRGIYSAGDLTDDGIQELALLLLDQQINGMAVSVRIIDPYWQDPIIDLTPEDLHFAPYRGAVSLAAGQDVNGDGFFDVIVGDANDSSGFDMSTYNQNAPQSPPLATYFLNIINAGRITITSISTNHGGTALPDVCEVDNPFIPLPPPGDNTGGGSGGNSGGGSSGDAGGSGSSGGSNSDSGSGNDSGNGAGSDSDGNTSSGSSGDEPTILSMIGSITSATEYYQDGQIVMGQAERAALRDSLRSLRREIKEQYVGAARRRRLKKFKRIMKNFRIATKQGNATSRRVRAWKRFSRILSRIS